jgi:opacity protein-like surface antigen
MRRALLLVLSSLLLVPVTFAQSASRADNKPRTEFFIGYSYLRADGLPNLQDNTFSDPKFGERAGVHGIDTSVTRFITPRFGITGDFSFNQKDRALTLSNGTGNFETRISSALVGPTFKFVNDSRLSPFVRALFGLANTRFDAEQQLTLGSSSQRNTLQTSANDFAMALGGGLDVRLSNRVDLRVLQIDYNPIFLQDRSVNVLNGAGLIQPQRLIGQRQDNLRLSFGVVFR